MSNYCLCKEIISPWPKGFLVFTLWRSVSRKPLQVTETFVRETENFYRKKSSRCQSKVHRRRRNIEETFAPVSAIVSGVAAANKKKFEPIRRQKSGLSRSKSGSLDLPTISGKRNQNLKCLAFLKNCQKIWPKFSTNKARCQLSTVKR